MPLSSTLIGVKAKKLFNMINTNSRSEFDFQARAKGGSRITKNVNQRNIKLVGGMCVCKRQILKCISIVVTMAHDPPAG